MRIKSFLLLVLISLSIQVSKSQVLFDGRNVVGDIINKEFTFASIDTLIASNVITDKSDVKYIAANRVLLKKGFKVHKNNSFKAYLSEQATSIDSKHQLKIEFNNETRTISFRNSDLQTEISGIYEIINISGQLVGKGNVVFNKEIETHLVHPGVYLIKVQLSDKNAFIHKFIVEN